MTLQQYLSILPCLLLPSGNLQTPSPSIPWCNLPISSSIFPSFLLLSLSPAELSSPCPRILRCDHTIWVSVSLPWLGDHHALQLHSGFCCEPSRSSHGLCRKCSEVSYSISSQGLGSFSRFLLSMSSSHRHKDERPHQLNLRSKRDVLVLPYDLQSRKSCCCLSYPGKNLGFLILRWRWLLQCTWNSPLRLAFDLSSWSRKRYLIAQIKWNQFYYFMYQNRMYVTFILASQN